MASDLGVFATTHAINCSIQVSSGSEERERRKEVRPGVLEPESGAIICI